MCVSILHLERCDWLVIVEVGMMAQKGVQQELLRELLRADHCQKRILFSAYLVCGCLWVFMLCDIS